MESEGNLDMFGFTIIKHCGDGKFVERIHASDFDQFVDLVFDLDIHGWELSGFSKSKYPRYPDSYSFYDGMVCAEFSRKGY
jgi:hypothetical protein